jgi:hypothetical protein
MRCVALFSFAVFLSATTASHADPLRLSVGGDSEDAMRQSLAAAAEALAGGPETARYLELTIQTAALHLLNANTHPLTADFCSFDGGKGNRRIRGIHSLGAEGTTAENVRYSIRFEWGAIPGSWAWTDLSCQYRDANLALVLRGHFVPEDLAEVEGVDVRLTAVAP